jgi:hypothetical protein
MLETPVHRRASVVTRVLAAAVLTATAAAALSGCSPGVDYPSLFPAVHDMPPPRAETTMDANQVQQATEDLITQRNHLEAQQGAASAKEAATPGAANPPAKKSQPSAAAGKSTTAAGATPGSAASGTQTAGTETK